MYSIHCTRERFKPESSVSMNAEVSEPIKAKMLGLSIQILEALKQRQIVLVV